MNKTVFLVSFVIVLTSLLYRREDSDVCLIHRNEPPDISGLNVDELLFRMWRSTRAIIAVAWNETASREVLLRKEFIPFFLGRHIQTDFFADGLTLTGYNEWSFRTLEEVINEMKCGFPIPEDLNCLQEEIGIDVYAKCCGVLPWTFSEIVEMIPRDDRLTCHSLYVVRGKDPVLRILPCKHSLQETRKN